MIIIRWLRLHLDAVKSTVNGNNEDAKKSDSIVSVGFPRFQSVQTTRCFMDVVFCEEVWNEGGKVLGTDPSCVDANCFRLVGMGNNKCVEVRNQTQGI